MCTCLVLCNMDVLVELSQRSPGSLLESRWYWQPKNYKEAGVEEGMKDLTGPGKSQDILNSDIITDL